MTMSEERLQQIRNRRESIDPGAWMAEDTEDYWKLSLEGWPYQILKAPKRNSPYAEYWPTPEYADFIVHSPEDMADLLEEVRRLQDHVKRLRADLDTADDELREVMNHNDQTCEAVAERDRLRAQLGL